MAQRPRPGVRPVALSLVVVLLAYLLLPLAGAFTPVSGLQFSDGNRLTFTAQDDADPTDVRRAADVVAQRLSDVPGATVDVSGDQVVVDYPGEIRPELTTTLAEGGRFGIRVVARNEVATAADPDASSDEATGDEADDPAGEQGAPDYGDPTLWAASPDADSLAAFEAFTCGPETEPVADEPDRPLLACDGAQKYLLSPVVVDTHQLTSATARAGVAGGDWSVRLRFDTSGTRAFTQMSGILAGSMRLFAVVLDGRVLAAPRMNATVTGGEAVITGNYTEETARSLAGRLDGGTLPVQFAADPETSTAPATLDRGDALVVLAVTLGTLLLLSLLAPVRLGRLGWVVPAALVASSALSLPVVVLLGQAVGLVLSSASLAGLAVGPIVAAGLASTLALGVSRGVAAGQSAKIAAEHQVPASRAEAGWATVVPLLVAGGLVAIGRGTLLQFGVGLAVAVVVAFATHLVLTTSLVSVLADRAGTKGVEVPALTLTRTTTYAGALVLLALAVLGLVLASGGDETAPVVAGETSTPWLVGTAVVAALLAGAIAWFRLDDLRPAVALVAGVVWGTVTALGLGLLVGAEASHPVLVTAGAVFVLCLVSSLAALAGQAPADRLPGLVLLGVPLLAAVLVGLVLGGLAPLVGVAVVLLLGLVTATIAPYLVVQLVSDLGRGSQKARIPAGKGAQRTLPPKQKPASGPKQSRGGSQRRPQQRKPRPKKSGRKSGAKRGKKK